MRIIWNIAKGLGASFFKQNVLPENEEGVFVIRSIKADFFTPASLGQVLEIRTQIKELRKVFVVLFQEIYCIQNASLEPMKPFKVFASEIKFGFVNRSTYSPIAIPKLFKELLSAVWFRKTHHYLPLRLGL